jgi:hypothetical protein
LVPTVPKLSPNPSKEEGSGGDPSKSKSEGRLTKRPERGGK